MAEGKMKDTRFDAVPAEEIKRVQEKLDAYCKEHGMETLNVRAGKGNKKWKELVLRLLGLPFDVASGSPRQPGRPPRTEEEVDKIMYELNALTMFGDLDGKERKAKLPRSKKQARGIVAKKLGIRKEKYKDKEKFHDPDEVIRGMENKHRRLVKKSRADWNE